MTMLVNLLVRDHLPQFLDHYSALTPDDRHNRFFHSMGPSAIRDWVLSTTERPYSHYFFIKENEEGEFEGLVTLGIHPESNEGNAAVSVLPHRRGQGLAQSLLGEAIEAAKGMKLKRLVFECLMNNHDCQRLYTKMGFTCKYNTEQQCLVGHLDLESDGG